MRSADLFAGEMPPGTLNTGRSSPAEPRKYPADPLLIGLMGIKASNATAELWSAIRDRALAGETKVQDVLNEAGTIYTLLL